MKTATVREIKQELGHLNPSELMELCLKLSRFKKENKELLTYLLFEAHDEESFITAVKLHIDESFELIHHDRFYYVKKRVRKVLKDIKKYIRYSKKKPTEVELLLYFCQKFQSYRPSLYKSITMKNLYHRQIEMIEKVMLQLDEDLQYDYNLELDELRKS